MFKNTVVADRRQITMTLASSTDQSHFFLTLQSVAIPDPGSTLILQSLGLLGFLCSIGSSRIDAAA